MVHIFRKANLVADKLASLYLHSYRVFEIVSSIPPAIRGVMALDVRGVPSVRTIVDEG